VRVELLNFRRDQATQSRSVLFGLGGGLGFALLAVEPFVPAHHVLVLFFVDTDVGLSAKLQLRGELLSGRRIGVGSFFPCDLALRRSGGLSLRVRVARLRDVDRSRALVKDGSTRNMRLDVADHVEIEHVRRGRIDVGHRGPLFEKRLIRSPKVETFFDDATMDLHHLFRVGQLGAFPNRLGLGGCSSFRPHAHDPASHFEIAEDRSRPFVERPLHATERSLERLC